MIIRVYSTIISLALIVFIYLCLIFMASNEGGQGKYIRDYTFHPFPSISSRLKLIFLVLLMPKKLRLEDVIHLKMLLMNH